MVLAIILLVPSQFRQNETVLTIACIAVFIGTWIDKGIGLISGGFVPNPLHYVNEYAPTFPELMITLGVYATGFFILSVFFKIALTIKEELYA
jgi:Ni/Fe-hydrogenase subunit HybB-like protein